MKKIFTALLTIILVSTIFNGIIFFSEVASATEYVSGIITADRTWTEANSPYILISDVVVDNGTTLTIEPGVTVKFADKYSLIVNGTLNATGTPSKPIIFTSNQSTPKKGDWNRVRLHGKNNTMDYCEISYGHYPLYIMGENTNNSIRNCKVSDNTGDGIYLKRTSNNTIDNITVSASYSNGITLLVSENNIINNSLVVNNRAFGIYLRSSNNNTIINTNVSNNKGGGIEFGLINLNIKIKNVTVFKNEDNGIDLNGNNYINITDSEIIGNDGNGIDFGGPSEHQWIENCTINRNGKSGIYLQRALYVDIVRCNISKNKGPAGIYSEKQVTNINITNSKVFENSEDGIEINEARFVNITNSNISYNIMNGIAFNGSHIQENNIIRNCSIAWNWYNGIYFYSYSDDPTIYIQNNNVSFNTIYSNGQNGIYFETYAKHYTQTAYSYIQYNKVYNNIIYSNNLNGICFKGYSEDYSYIQYNFFFFNTIYSNNQNGINFNPSGGYRAFIQYNNIYNNTIHSNKHNGIFFGANSQTNGYLKFQINNIYFNKIYLNGQNGIYFYCRSRYGSELQNNNIYYNFIYSNSQNGIYFNSINDEWREFSYLQNNDIYSNTIYSNNKNGIYFNCRCKSYRYYLQYNNLYSNTIYLNNQNGIYFYGYSDDYSSYRYSFFRENSIYSNTIYSNNQNGIFLYGNSRNGKLYLQNNMIYSNTIYMHTIGSGIYEQTDNNTVTWENSHLYNNTIISNLIGIKFIRIKSHIVNINNISNNFNDGILLDSSTSNTFGYNKISNNNWSGINLTANSNKNKIQNNNITSNNRYGIYLNKNSNDNTITRNDILDHPGIGVNITGSKDNLLHHNNLKNNTQNAYDSTTQLNDWDDGTEGNWWDDYTGFDSDNNGIGDIPYDVPGGGSKDWYPIIKPANITAPHVESTSPEDGEVNVSVTPQISITFSNKMNTTVTENTISMSGGLFLKNFTWSNGDMTVTFEPTATLSSSTTYTITISISAKDVLDNHLENAYQFSFTTKDIIPPKIKLTSPAHKSTEITLDTKIVVTFTEPMNSTSVILLCSPDPGEWSVVWSNKSSIATYSHNDFGSLTTYEVRITAGMDIGGNELVAGSMPNPWTFTTEDVVGPEITTTSPSNGSVGVLLDAKVVVTFSEQMNTSSVTYSCNPDPGGWNLIWTNGDKTVTCSHGAFKSHTIYTFQVLAGKDLAGNTLNPSIPNPWSFTTQDTTPPEISVTSPSDGAQNVPLNAKIIITFSEAMDNTTISYNCNPNPGGWIINWSGGNTVVTFSHNLFNENTNYTFQIIGGKDVAGNNLIAGSVPNPWSFSTPNLAAPEILATMPTNSSVDIALNVKIVVTFSEAMNTATVAYTCSPNPGGWSVTWSKSNTIATYLHTLFSSSTKYIFQITAGKDLAGNDLISGSIPNPWTFTTIDAVAPTIISVSPQSGSSNVAQSANVVVAFSEQMDKTTVSFTYSPNPTGWSVVWSTKDTVATFMHNPFDRFTTYSFHITSGKDLTGNNLISGTIPNPWSFTTLENVPPTILSDPIITGIEKMEYIYDVEAFDINNDIITYTLTSHPTGMSIDNSTGKITWKPTNAQVGINPVVVLVIDEYGGTDTQSFNITVKNVNDLPRIISTPITTATQNEEYIYQVEAIDIDVNDILTFILQIPPVGMTIDSLTGLISWVPTNDQVGTSSVIVVVSDGNGGMDTQSFPLIVSNANDAPKITSTPILTAKEDSQYTYDVEAVDIDIEDKLTYSLAVQPTDMVININNGLITWVPTNEQVGVNFVTIKVIDKFDGVVTQSFNITVINVNDPPTIISTPVASAIEDKLYTYEVRASDIDPTNDNLTFKLITYPAGMEIDSETGIITWTPTNDQIDRNKVTVSVSDGNEGEDAQDFIIDVLNINDPPIIISTPITTASEDNKYTYDVDALDVDIGDTLTYILDKYPEGMQINGKTGIITWTPANDQVGVNSITVKVIDSNGEFTTQSFSITVININNPPIVTSTPITSATVNTEYVYDTNAIDLDPTKDNLTFSLTTYSEGMKINPVTGVLTWTPSKNQAGLNDVRVLVTDGKNGQNSQYFTITVESPEYAEKEPTQKEGAQRTDVYSMIIFVTILLIVFFILIVLLFRREKPLSKEDKKR